MPGELYYEVFAPNEREELEKIAKTKHREDAEKVLTNWASGVIKLTGRVIYKKNLRG